MADVEREAILRIRAEDYDTLTKAQGALRSLDRQMGAHYEKMRRGGRLSDQEQHDLANLTKLRRNLTREIRGTVKAREQEEREIRRSLSMQKQAAREMQREMRSRAGRGGSGFAAMFGGRGGGFGRFLAGETRGARVFSDVTGLLAGNILRLGVTLGGAVIAGREFARVMGAIAEAMDRPIKTASELERHTIRFTALLQNEEEAIIRVGKAAEYSFKTPFELTEVVNADAILEGFSIAGERNLKRVADMAAAFGTNIEDAALALGKLRLGQFERLERFGITRPILAERMGVELNEIRQNTPATLALIWEEATKLIDQKTKDAADRLSKSYEGILSNIRGEWQRTNMVIAEMGAFEQRKKAAEDQLAIVKEIGKSWENIGKMEAGKILTKGVYRFGGEFREGGFKNMLALLYTKMFEYLVAEFESAVPLGLKEQRKAERLREAQYQGFPGMPTESEWKAIAAANEDIAEKTEYQVWLEKQLTIEKKKQTEEMYKQQRAADQLAARLAQPGHQALLAGARGAAAPGRRAVPGRQGEFEPQAAGPMAGADLWQDPVEFGRAFQEMGAMVADANLLIGSTGEQAWLKQLYGLNAYLEGIARTEEAAQRMAEQTIRDGEKFHRALKKIVAASAKEMAMARIEAMLSELKVWRDIQIAKAMGAAAEFNFWGMAKHMAAAAAASAIIGGARGAASAGLDKALGLEEGGGAGAGAGAEGMTTAGGVTKRNLLSQRMAAPMTINITINNNFYGPVYAESPQKFFDEQMAPYVEDSSRRLGWGVA